MKSIYYIYTTQLHNTHTQLISSHTLRFTSLMFSYRALDIAENRTVINLIILKSLWVIIALQFWRIK